MNAAAVTRRIMLSKHPFTVDGVVTGLGCTRARVECVLSYMIRGGTIEIVTSSRGESRGKGRGKRVYRRADWNSPLVEALRSLVDGLSTWKWFTLQDLAQRLPDGHLCIPAAKLALGVLERQSVVVPVVETVYQMKPGRPPARWTSNAVEMEAQKALREVC